MATGLLSAQFNYLQPLLVHRVDVLPGTLGKWTVRQVVCDERGAVMHNLQEQLHGSGRFILPATYTGLYQGSTLWMSDTPAEIADHLPIYRRATGRVLVVGLGLGAVVKLLLSKPDVTAVDVLEIDADLITLVGQCYLDPRVTFYRGDVFTRRWLPEQRWDYAWFDIWPALSADNLPEMARLRRRYARHVPVNAMLFWGELECKRARRRWR